MMHTEYRLMLRRLKLVLDYLGEGQCLGELFSGSGLVGMCQFRGRKERGGKGRGKRGAK